MIDGQRVALIYIRRSMVRYEQDRASPERQLDNCIRVCKEKGWTCEIFQDAEGHRSGRSEKHRPEWRRLKTQLSRPEVVAVVVNSLDRASRSPMDFFTFLNLLQKHDVEIVSVHERFDTTTAIGKAFLAMLMVVASLESDLASERIIESVRHRRTKGIHVGIAPFGYDRQDGRLVPNDDSRIVELLMQLYSTGRYSYANLAAELNRRGYRFRDRYTSKPFTKGSLRSILQNAWLYAGRLPVGRERAGAYSEMYEGQHDALIPTDVAARVEELRHKRAGATARGRSRVYLLSGMVFCHECGDRLWGTRRRKNLPASYRHSHHACQRSKGSFNANDLEEQVLQMLDGLVLPPHIEEAVTERVRERVETEPRNTELLAKLEASQTKLVRLREMRLEGEIDREGYFTAKAEMTAEVADIQTRLGLCTYDAHSALERIGDVGKVVREGSPEQQRGVLQTVFERLEVSVESAQIIKVVPRPWFADLFRDLFHVVDGECAWRDSNPRPHRFEVCGSIH